MPCLVDIPGCLLFLKGNGKRVDLKERGDGGGERKGRKGSCNQNITCERKKG